MMNTKVLLALPMLGLLGGVCSAAEPLKLETENEKINYSVGYQLGGDFKRQEVDIKSDMLIQGIEDAISGGKPLLDDQEQRATIGSTSGCRSSRRRTPCSHSSLSSAENKLARTATRPQVIDWHSQCAQTAPRSSAFVATQLT